jgi:tetratricopeptide (TPR) repeat protein
MSIQVDSLAEIKTAIQAGNKGLARELLRSEIKENPTADTWYFASLVAGNREQSISFLNKALDLDPFHDQALAALDKLQVKKVRTANSISSVAETSNVLNDSIALFVQNDWELKLQMPNMAQLEKRKGVSKLASFLVILFFGLLGMLIVIAGIATAKMEKISLQAQPDGSVRVMGNKINTVVQDASQLSLVASSVKDGVTYAGAIGFGLLMTVIWLVIL